MRRIAGAAFIVTLFTLLGQAVAFATQVVMAAVFGARTSMDAFLAANAIPQYVIAVLLGSLGVVFIPVFIDYLTTGSQEEAWQIASSVINLTLIGLAVLILLAILSPETILGISAPGLPKDVRQQAVEIALITWPSVLATGVIALLTGIYQSQSRFGWPAAVPVVGAILNLLLIIVLTPRLGIIGLAIANTIGIVLQAGLLLPLAFGQGRYRFILNLYHPGVRQVLRLLFPLVLANVVSKATPVIDRYFASQMPEGSISHLGYAFRIFSVLSLLISSGISTVIFPRMAMDVAGTALASLRRTMSVGLRVMWFIIAPAMTIGIALALPLVTVVFRHGQFSTLDAVAVSGLFQIYLLALPPACLGTITGRGFYALKDTRTVAIVGTLEGIAYIFYTALLSRKLGVTGVAFAYVIFFNFSLLWQVVVIRHRAGQVGGRTVVNSFMRTGLVALLAGVAAWATTLLTANIWIQLILGAMSGLLVYSLGIWLLQTSEIQRVWGFS